MHRWHISKRKSSQAFCSHNARLYACVCYWTEDSNDRVYMCVQSGLSLPVF